MADENPIYAPFFGVMGAASDDLQRHGSGVRDRQVRDRYRRHVRDAARAHHEVYYPRRHGGYLGHLRRGGSSPHRWKAVLNGIHTIPGIPSLGSWSCGGSFSLSGWLRDRDRGRRRCPRHCPTAKIIRGNDPHSNFRRGLGSLRTDRGHFPFHQERLNWTRVILSIAAAVVVTEKINKCSNLQSVEQWRPNPKESGILDYIRFHVSRFYFDIIQNVFCINSVFHAKYQTKLILYRNLTWNIFTGFSTHTTRETIISISAFTFNITQQLVTYFCDLLIVINDTYLVRTNSGAIFNAWFQTIACEHYIPSMRRWN